MIRNGGDVFEYTSKYSSNERQSRGSLEFVSYIVLLEKGTQQIVLKVDPEKNDNVNETSHHTIK